MALELKKILGAKKMTVTVKEEVFFQASSSYDEKECYFDRKKRCRYVDNYDDFRSINNDCRRLQKVSKTWQWMKKKKLHEHHLLGHEKHDDNDEGEMMMKKMVGRDDVVVGAENKMHDDVGHSVQSDDERKSDDDD